MDRADDEARTGAAEQGPRWPVAVLVVLALLLFVGTRAAFLSVPLERDEGEYAYIAQRWLAGEVPYRDTFDQKPPGVFLVYAAAFLLGGESTEGIHAALAVFSGLTALLLAWLVGRAGGALAGAFAALAYAVASIDPSLTAMAANTEAFMLLPLVGSLVSLRAGLNGRRGSIVVCGACLALACWFKPVAATQILLVVGVLGVHAARQRALGSLPGDLGRLALGGLLVSIPFAAPFALADGAWSSFLDAVFLHNLDYASSVDVAGGMQLLSRRLANWAPGASGLLALALAAAAAPRGSVSGRGLALGWLIAGALGASVGLMFRPHYLLQIVPPLAWLAALGARGLVLRAHRPQRPALALGLAALVVGPYALAHGSLLGETPQVVSRTIYGGNPFPESAPMAQAIAERSAADDRVLVVGSEPQVLFLARRRSATRYIILHPVLGPFADAEDRQQEVLREIAATQPALVLWVDVPTSFATPRPERSTLLRAVRTMLDADYELDVLAAPTDTESVFTFWYGAAARRTARRQRAALDAGVHLALYRRRSS